MAAIARETGDTSLTGRDGQPLTVPYGTVRCFRIGALLQPETGRSNTPQRSFVGLGIKGPPVP
jgi:hypothetical protein